MIELKEISVAFVAKEQTVRAVRNASLAIAPGEIFGIVGTSGAGKSTLLRVINLLERPGSGRVVVDGRDITGLTGAALRSERQKIGMIFQHFNLMHTCTVYENVAFPLQIAGQSRQQISERVPELLGLVGLADKAKAYPAQLSGGQKQRVGIARAIANRPQVLLCDEPTSALDLESSAAILELLREINARLGITIVLISHEMNVIKRICTRVAVMDQGEVIEHGDVYDIFATPQAEFTRQLVDHTFNLELPARLYGDVDQPDRLFGDGRNRRRRRCRRSGDPLRLLPLSDRRDDRHRHRAGDPGPARAKRRRPAGQARRQEGLMRAQ